MTDQREGYAALWLWFGLSRAGWLTIPRCLLHEMPDEWQARMAALLNEYDETYPNQPDISTFVSIKKGNKFTREYAWLHNYRHPDAAKIAEMKGDK